MLGRNPTSDDRRQMAATLGIDEATFATRYWQYRPEFDLGHLAPAGYWSAVAERELEPGLVGRLVDMDIASWTRGDEATLAVALDVAAAGSRLVLLSNAPETFARVIDKLNWLEPFEPRFFSCWTGLVKPDPRAFLNLIEAVGVAPGDALLVDDLAPNVAAAAGLGIHSILFQGAEGLARRIREASGET